MGTWFVARTQNNRERWAAENVARQSYSYYLPLILESAFEEVSGRRVKTARAVPLFRNYLFVESPHAQWHFLLGTYGISSVVMQGSGPAVMRDSEIARLRGREENGVVKLPRRDLFAPGHSARLVGGAFQGHTVLVEGTTPALRVRVLLDFLGGRVSLLVPEAELAAA